MTNRKRKTWTFQPDDDVIELANALFGEEPEHGERTRFINEAIRFNYPDASLVASQVVTAQREVEEANMRLERMREMLNKIKERAPKSSPKLNVVLTPEQIKEKAIEGSSRASRLRRESEKKQTTELPNENKSSPAGGGHGRRH